MRMTRRTRPRAVIATALMTTIACAANACAQNAPAGDLPDCVWCGAQDAPDNINSHILTIPDDDEPGERIILRGRVFQADGETPAPDVLLYAYHTDSEGIYRTEGGETGNGVRHGVLRGWLRTDDQGRYEIRTIKPAPYPSRNEPAHIHITLTPQTGPDAGEEDWVNSFHFAGDPLLTDRQIRESNQAGRFADIVELTPDDNGVLTATRNIRFRR